MDMKKIAVFLASVFGAVCLFTGCRGEQVQVALGDYVWSGEEQVQTAAIRLQQENEFRMMLSPLSSYYGIGTYQIQDGRLIATTDDREFQYVFQIEGETLAFDEQRSSELMGVPFSDGAVFEKIDSVPSAVSGE